MATEFASIDWENISSKYDTFFVDIVGVVYDGITPYPEAIKSLNNMGNDKNIIFISNNPRPSSLSIEKLRSFQLNIPFQIITSGDLSRHFLRNDEESVYFHWGAHKNNDILRDININTTDNISMADKVLLTAFLEENEDENQFESIIESILDKEIPVYCANPDKKALYGKEIRKCAGHFAEKLRTRGGEVFLWGKPETDIFSLAKDQYPHLIKGKERCLMIGDTLETDIHAANKLGIDSLLVLSGISALEYPDHNIYHAMDHLSIKPTYLLPYFG